LGFSKPVRRSVQRPGRSGDKDALRCNREACPGEAGFPRMRLFGHAGKTGRLLYRCLYCSTEQEVAS
jgi:hypothetical protein